MDTPMNSFDEDFENFMDLDKIFGIDLKSLNSLLDDGDLFNEMDLEISSTSDEQSVPNNSSGKVSRNIPTDRREWSVIDRISRRRRPPFLYEFLILLVHKSQYASYFCYKDKANGLFEIIEPDKVADLWQQVKNRQSNKNMTYDNFARAIRCYYKPDIMRKTNTRYTFQFSPRTLAAIIVDENNNITINSPV